MNLRLSILLVAILLLFGGTFLVVRFTGSNEPTPDNPWLFRIDEDDISHITVNYRGQTVDYDRNPGSFKWVIQGDPDVPVFQKKWGGTPLLVSGPRVSRVLDRAPDDLTPYGLQPPLSKIWVTDSTGNTVEFHMGDPTPDAENHYARLVGDPALFTLPTTWAEVINRLVIEPPYPPEDEEGTPAPG